MIVAARAGAGLAPGKKMSFQEKRTGGVLWAQEKWYSLVVLEKHKTA